MASESAGHIPTPASSEAYQVKPTVKYAATVGAQAGVVGAVVSAIQNALGTHNKGALGVFTRSGGTIGFFGAFFFLVVG